MPGHLDLVWFQAVFPPPRPTPLPRPVEWVDCSGGQWGSPGHTVKGLGSYFAAIGLMGDLGLSPWASVFSSVKWRLTITELLPPERPRGSHEATYCQGCLWRTVNISDLGCPPQCPSTPRTFQASCCSTPTRKLQNLMVPATHSLCDLRCTT